MGWGDVLGIEKANSAGKAVSLPPSTHLADALVNIYWAAIVPQALSKVLRIKL